MRGTKHANDATAKRLNRQLRQLLDDPDSYLPTMTWKGRLSWGRGDPVTKTLQNLKKIVAERRCQMALKAYASETWRSCGQSACRFVACCA